MDGTQQPGPSRFESLPLEIRRQIYRYLLPHSVVPCDQEKFPIWRLGNTAILAVNRQIHEEAADLMYGDSWFYFDVQYNRFRFVIHISKRDDYVCDEVEYWIPNSIRFFEDICPKNLSRIRHLQVYIYGPTGFESGRYNKNQHRVFCPGLDLTADEAVRFPPTAEGYQAIINALADMVSMLSESLKQIPSSLELQVIVWMERKEPDLNFEYALAKPLLELNSRKKSLWCDLQRDSNVEQELW